MLLEYAECNVQHLVSKNSAGKEVIFLKLTQAMLTAITSLYVAPCKSSPSVFLYTLTGRLIQAMIVVLVMINWFLQ